MNQATAVQTQEAQSEYGINVSGMPMGLAIMFNDKLYERCKQIAGIMARADGFTPPHLIGKTEACFAVVTRSITWKLDPQAVAQSTYQTPGGRVGYEGKLVQAILENSGKLLGNVDYELIGNWDKIIGNFEVKKSEKGKDYAVPRWTREDAKTGGCGVIVSAQIKGEEKRRVLKFMLETCFPLNSTLWATRPDQQIKYTGCRAFANTVAPGIMMGEPFDIDPNAGMAMKDITPPRRPQRSDFEEQKNIDIQQKETVAVDEEAAETGEVHEYSAADAFSDGAKAKDDGKILTDMPLNIRTFPHLSEAWTEGFNSEAEA